MSLACAGNARRRTVSENRLTAFLEQSNLEGGRPCPATRPRDHQALRRFYAGDPDDAVAAIALTRRALQLNLTCPRSISSKA